MRIAVVVALSACTGLHASPVRCPHDTAIVVETGEHRMALCERGEPVRELSVAIGGGGTGKQREGDRKTPLGSYPLEAPVVSSRFHRFIGVGYPTAAQVARGMTGFAVGIHGPSRKRLWLARIRHWFDWTDGCIAVASDRAIEEVAVWVTRAGARRVEIR